MSCQRVTAPVSWNLGSARSESEKSSRLAGKTLNVRSEPFAAVAPVMQPHLSAGVCEVGFVRDVRGRVVYYDCRLELHVKARKTDNPNRHSVDYSHRRYAFAVAGAWHSMREHYRMQ